VRRDRRPGPSRGAPRGQTEVIGVVLLVAIAVLGAVVIGLLGSQSLDATRRSADLNHAESALSQLDARTSDVALDLDSATAETSLELSRGRHRLRLVTSSWLRVDLVNATTGVVDAEVVNASPLGTVEYQRGSTTVAYEGGGVWRSDAGHAVMRSPPEFHYRNGTLTVPVVALSGDPVLTDPVRVTRDGPPETRFPNASAGLTNRVRDVKVRATVHSDYYAAWARFFETTGGYVTVDPAAETATVTFLALPKTLSLRSGIIATSGAGEVSLQGNSIYIDSYDSSRGNYSTTKGANGSITAVNDVSTTGSSHVQGDVRSGATVSLSGTTDINGTVYWTDGYSSGGASVSGGDQQIPGVATIEPVDGFVRQAVSRARLANNDSAVSVITGNQLSGSGTLPAGTYYVDDLTVGSGDTLTLNTTGGDVVVAVGHTVSVVGKGTSSSQAARIDVVGNGTATFYVLGGDPVDFEVGKNGKVDVPGERSGQFQVYGTQDFDAVLTSDQSPAEIRFEGVIYAPAGLAGTGSVTIGQAKFFGAIVSGDLTIKQGAEIHYDQGLAAVPFARSPSISRLAFMHVGLHRVTVTG